MVLLLDRAGQEKKDARQLKCAREPMGDKQSLPALPGLNMEKQEPAEIREPGHRPAPRFESINRQQMVMRAVDVERLVDEDHSVRAIWEFVGRLDLDRFCEQIRAVEGERGRPAHDPRLMISLWVYGYARGVSSAREIARLCEYDPAFQWLTGMKVVNHHSLSDFRVDHSQALDKLFAEVLAVLMQEGLVSLERVMHDGTKIEARASRHSFRTEKSIGEHLGRARRHVEEMKAQSEEDMKGREAKARERAARQRVERLESAQKEFEKIRTSQTGEEKKKKEKRVSEAEPEARIMKHNDGGFRPSYNAQISTDQLCTLIVGVGLSQAAGDSDELEGAVDRAERNTGKLPEQLVADGAYASAHNIHVMRERGVELITPAADTVFQLEKSGIDEAFSRNAFVYDQATNSYTCPASKILKFIGKEKRGKIFRERYRASVSDCQACPFKMKCCPRSKRGRTLMRLENQSEVDDHAARMQKEEAKQIYKLRGQTAEFPSAWIKEKIGLRRFRVGGLLKAGLELVWACLTYNIQQWIRLRWKTICAQAKT
jgi:transposase